MVQAARVALSEIGAPDAQQLPSLLKTLQDPRDSVRCEAVLSIGKMGPAAQEAAAPLYSWATSSGRTTRPVCFEEALGSLAEGLPSVFPPDIDLLLSGFVEIRRKAAHVLALSGVKSSDSISRLLEALGHEPDSKTRMWLAKALQLPYTPDADRMAVLDDALHDGECSCALRSRARNKAKRSARAKNAPLILKMLKILSPRFAGSDSRRYAAAACARRS